MVSGRSWLWFSLSARVFPLSAFHPLPFPRDLLSRSRLLQLPFFPVQLLSHLVVASSRIPPLLAYEQEGQPRHPQSPDLKCEALFFFFLSPSSVELKCQVRTFSERIKVFLAVIQFPLQCRCELILSAKGMGKVVIHVVR